MLYRFLFPIFFINNSFLSYSNKSYSKLVLNVFGLSYIENPIPQPLATSEKLEASNKNPFL